MSTLNSLTDLNLDNVPQVSDPETFRALLKIHSAIEILLSTADVGGSEGNAFITKFRNVVAKSDNYNIVAEDGTILVAATTKVVSITLPLASTVPGYRYNIKCVAGPFNVRLLGSGADLIDGHVGGVELDYLDSYTVISFGSGWAII